MNRLDTIGVRVETPSGGAAPSYVPALLREIEALLTALVEHGRSGRIDLRSLPLLPGDDARLADALGRGEVEATVEAMGATRVRETAVAGVWWVSHADLDGSTVAEFLEITQVPSILATPMDDARMGLAALRSRLSE